MEQAVSTTWASYKTDPTTTNKRTWDIDSLSDPCGNRTIGAALNLADRHSSENMETAEVKTLRLTLNWILTEKRPGHTGTMHGVIMRRGVSLRVGGCVENARWTTIALLRGRLRICPATETIRQRPM